ncbi:GNAT family N-acetyltransferase [Serinicoccus sediminis]|uniref:GNAT family N-acetyltransferase n=1 Tax=Serinicoccus sediminis TaxID=2306021 RepID=UPI001021A344|nr:GNAT family protein [Serinicoccus sediminis]
MSPDALEEIWPPYALRVEAGDLTLSVLRERDVPEMVTLALEGIHDPGTMPFLFPWTAAPPAEIPANYVRYFGRVLAGQASGAMSLQLVVRRDGEAVGIQALEGEEVSTTRTVETGSWLVRREQRKGIGSRMRRMACALAFDHLGIERVTSAAYLDNPASLAVSRAVGYQDNGRTWVARQGESAEQQRFVLTPETFRRGEPIRVEGAVAVRAFYGLD